MVQFLDCHTLQINSGEMYNLNRPISSKESKPTANNFPWKEAPGRGILTGDSC